MRWRGPEGDAGAAADYFEVHPIAPPQDVNPIVALGGERARLGLEVLRRLPEHCSTLARRRSETDTQ